MSSRSRRAATAGLLIALVGSFYAATYDFREITDNRANSLATRAFVEHADLDLSRYHVPKRAFVRRHDTDLYSIYGVGVSLVAAPIYAIAIRFADSEAVLQGVVAIPFCAAAVVAMFALLLDVFRDRRLAAVGAVALGFGTTMWPLASMAFYSHGMVALCEILGIRALFSRKPWAATLAGLGFGAAAMIRPPAGMFVVTVGAMYLLTERRSVLRYVAGVLPAASVMFVQNRWLWGSWLRNGYSLAGIGFHGNIPADLWRLTFGWWRGLFVYSPFLLIGIIGAALLVHRARSWTEQRLLALGVGWAAMLILYASFSTWWGGLAQFGYRYLLDGIPALVLLGVYALKQSPRLTAPAGALLGMSLLTMAFGSVQKFGAFDNNLFPKALTDGPLGQAWIVGVQHPLGPALRIAGVAVVGLVLWRSAGDFTGAPGDT